jgi:hypothetical protein
MIEKCCKEEAYFAGHSAVVAQFFALNKSLWSQGLYCQLFAELFDQSRRKIRLLRKKIRSLSNFPFLKEFGLKKNTIFVCASGKITIFLGHFPFRPFLFKIGQNSAAELSVRSTFYSVLFYLCGRTIGQLASLHKGL